MIVDSPPSKQETLREGIWSCRKGKNLLPSQLSYNHILLRDCCALHSGAIQGAITRSLLCASAELGAVKKAMVENSPCPHSLEEEIRMDSG